jgi:hypothetical protein
MRPLDQWNPYVIQIWARDSTFRVGKNQTARIKRVAFEEHGAKRAALRVDANLIWTWVVELFFLLVFSQ